MDIKINVTRGLMDGQVENANWDPAFMQKIHEWYDRNHEDHKPGDGFQLLSNGHRKLIQAIEEILGEEQELLKITLTVEGKPKRYASDETFFF